MSDSSPFDHHASYYLNTNGYLRKGAWIHNYLIVHTDRVPTNPRWEEGFLNCHPRLLFATCFWICFPGSNGNLFLLSLCSVLRHFQINPLIIWLSKCINTLEDLQEFASGGHHFPSLRQCIIANQELQHSAERERERERLWALMPLRKSGRRKCLQAADVSLLIHPSHVWRFWLILQPQEIFHCSSLNLAGQHLWEQGYVVLPPLRDWGAFLCQPSPYLLQRCEYYRESSTYWAWQKRLQGIKSKPLYLTASYMPPVMQEPSCLTTLNWLNPGNTPIQYGAVTLWVSTMQGSQNTRSRVIFEIRHSIVVYLGWNKWKLELNSILWNLNPLPTR